MRVKTSVPILVQGNNILTLEYTEITITKLITKFSIIFLLINVL